MDNSSASNINSPRRVLEKYVIKIGDVTLVPLDKSIVRSLRITEHTILEQEESSNGINLRILKRAKYQTNNHFDSVSDILKKDTGRKRQSAVTRT